MRKFILAFLMLIATTATFSQTKMYAYGLEHGSWNASAEKWEFNNYRKVNLAISIYSNAIYINDAAQTSFRVESYEGERKDRTSDGELYTANAWGCYDEKNRRCTFSIVKYHTTQDILITIRYNNYSFRYYVRSNDVDNF
jgi:hypothetical protein